jgi:hypothetical protein
MTASCVYEGWVRHRRFEPVAHAFRYPLALVYLDLDELPAVVRRFRRADYLGDRREPLRDAVLDLVSERTGRRPEGPVRLLTQLRRFGVGFNPVSFYYCFDRDGRRVEALAAEVTNTPWAERHTYVLAGTSGVHVKRLHVSPFLDMDAEYAWRVSEPSDSLHVHIESRHAARRVFDATLSLRQRELGAHVSSPLSTLARIYLQALRLKLRGAPVHPHP